MSKKWGLLRALGLWILFFFAFLMVISMLPGTSYIDDETGNSTMHDGPALLCLIAPTVLTYIVVKRHNNGKRFRVVRKLNDHATIKDGVSGHPSLNYSLLSDEELIPEAKRIILETGQSSTSILQRHMYIGYARAANLIDLLEEEGFLGPYNGSADREILYNPFQAQSILKVDLMEGHDFERWCATLLEKHGYEKVEVTPGSGDQGVDVLAEKDGVKYAFQCKCYSQDLGNTPVQEVEAGRIYYGCHVGVVMTNRFFTKGAKELAQKTGTLLWDRDKLIEMLEGQ